MAVNVETLEKLERKVTLTLPVSAIETEVENRLKRLARQVKVDGLRPGHHRLCPRYLFVLECLISPPSSASP